ncbi:MAG: R3H domain-containing nucleic acid-binding protein [Atopobiaceae bacterium]|jgi:spoIIIJ-associated protein|nr:KH domain-containing protein [Atopobiaceae bacterium]
MAEDEEKITNEGESTEDSPSQSEQEGPYSSLKEHYSNGEDLTDDELDTIADVSVTILRSILGCFGEGNADIDEYEGDEGELILDVSNGDLAVLIGRHGKTLEALQLIVSSLVNRKLGFHYPVVVDIEGYKDRRKQKIQSMAHSAASRAKKQNGQVRLSPMNGYERRLVHMALADDASVTTHSEGVDPDRYVVITAVR